MQFLIEAVGMRFNASNTKVMPALIPGQQRQAVLLDVESLEENFNNLGSMIVANGQGPDSDRKQD